jgi:septal ring-binding cell division protein DamX
MMKNKKNFIVLGFCVVNLCSCMVDDNESYTPSYSTDTYESQLYPTVNYTNHDTVYNYKYSNSEPVTVPDSYHVGEYHSPVSFKDRDKTWVSGQNPQGYTIEIAEGDKAAQVAQKLYKAPKNDRMAQVKYQVNGKSYYKGVYGTYPDAASAQKALEALPAEIKQGATVKNWSSMQQNLE